MVWGEWTVTLSLKYSFFSDLFYGGEGHSIEQPQSYTCPLCGEIGLSDTDLRDHVARQHTNSSNVQEVVRRKLKENRKGQGCNRNNRN